MTITSIGFNNVSQPPSVVITTNDTYATITQPGYLDSQASQILFLTGKPFPWDAGLIIHINYVDGPAPLFSRDPITGTLSETIPTGTGNTLYVLNVSVGHTALASGGHVNLKVASSTTAQYIVTAAFTSAAGSTNFSGGGGNRNLLITDGTSSYGTISNTSLGSAASAAYSYGNGIVLPTANAVNTPSAAGSNIKAIYTGGTTDWTAGTILINLFLLQVTN